MLHVSMPPLTPGNGVRSMLGALLIWGPPPPDMADELGTEFLARALSQEALLLSRLPLNGDANEVQGW